MNNKYLIYFGWILFGLLFFGGDMVMAATFENPISSTTVPMVIADLVRGILGFLGALCAVLIAYCGFRYMTAGGDSGKSKGAIECIVNAILGLIIAMAAYLVADYVISAISELA